MEKIETSGLYIISDQFFIDYPNDRYMNNKGEARPHYYALQDSDGIFWMIPLSSKVAKYRSKIAETETTHGKGSCFMFCIVPIQGKDRAVLVCDMFPVSSEYILRPYEISGCPYVIRNKNTQKTIRTKAMRYLSLIKRGILHSPLNILDTKRNLLEKAKNATPEQQNKKELTHRHTSKPGG